MTGTVAVRRDAKQKVLWLTWEKQVRNRSMSRELGVPLFVILSDRGRIARYASCINKTIGLLYREKPSIVICQNPSIVLTLLLLFLRSLFGFKLCIDAHFGGIDDWTGSNTFQRVLDYCNRTAELVIVTNESHANHVRSLGGDVFVCPDPLPDLSEYRGHSVEIPYKVFYICSFDVDEPYREVFHAAEILAPEGFRFFVSGNYRKAGIKPAEFQHVELLGFVPEAEFIGHLFSAQVVIDLTENDNCLVCGAYEAFAACKPLVLSGKKVLKEFFTGGTVFTENQAEDIAVAVRVAHLERLRLAEESRQWVLQERGAMKERIDRLKIILDSI